MLCFRKFLKTSEDIHHWFTRRNNSSFVHNLGFVFSDSELEREVFPFKINECGCHKDTFLGDVARKVSYGLSELSRNFGNSLDKTF
ncbi:hypothetical protein AVEN_192478-1 [Araneus ventricosus]|uniref:Uncharacterized protein n=1 Tax=Araneus ventricosus TaxID=182803 RepID=A0A4Y2M2U5_ARAVE|nr:hypothetical protein AVEN_192478-1 [Araneus ventricosus]